MFIIVFVIHCNFFIVLPIRLKTCGSNVFSFYKAKCARPKNQGHLRGCVRPSALDWHRACNLSRPVSACKDIYSGVSQDSVLGPFFFNIFINVIFSFLTAWDMCSCADDNMLRFQPSSRIFGKTFWNTRELVSTQLYGLWSF